MGVVQRDLHRSDQKGANSCRTCFSLLPQSVGPEGSQKSVDEVKNTIKMVVPRSMPPGTELCLEEQFHNMDKSTRTLGVSITSGELKLGPDCDSLRADPRFNKLLERLSPDGSLAKQPT
jgi:hypothetical protein